MAEAWLLNQYEAFSIIPAITSLQVYLICIHMLYAHICIRVLQFQ